LRAASGPLLDTASLGDSDGLHGCAEIGVGFGHELGEVLGSRVDDPEAALRCYARSLDAGSEKATLGSLPEFAAVQNLGAFDPIASLLTSFIFSVAILAVAAAVIGLMICHRRHPLPIVPTTWLGKGQLLYLVFLWWMITGNFERALVSFSPQRLATEGVLLLNAVICTVMVLLAGKAEPNIAVQTSQNCRWRLRIVTTAGIAAMILSVLLDWGIVRAMYGDQFAGQAGLHIRFGPTATATPGRCSPPTCW
jgi:hypothetical protein